MAQENLIDLFMVEAETNEPAVISQPTEVASAAAIKTQLPSFSSSDPEIFFIQCEVIFNVNNIRNSNKKFAYVISQLDRHAIREVIDMIRNPPEANPYEALKTRILETFGMTDEAKLNKLLGEHSLGNRRPSQLLRELRDLGGPTMSEELLGRIWLKSLPQALQVALAAIEQKDLNKLGAVADRVASVSVPHEYEVVSVSGRSPNSREDRLREAIEKLTERVAALETQGRFPQERTTTKSQIRNKDVEKRMCFYHERFGQRATKCRSPCNWSSGQGN